MLHGHQLPLAATLAFSANTYVSYGTSFNPSAETVTLSANNEGVDSEENRFYEVGAKWDLLGGKLLLTSSVFRVEKTNARETVSPGDVQLVGHTRVDGYELGAIGRLTDNWQVFAGYTFLDSEIVNSELPAPTTC